MSDRKKFNKYFRQSSEFWIRKEDENQNFLFFEKSSFFKKLNIGELDLFLSKTKKGRLELYTVSEGISGCRVVGFYRKPHLAIKAAKNFLSNYFKLSLLEKKVHEKIDGKLISPRYRFIANPNRIVYVDTRKIKNKKSNNTLRYGIKVC